MSLSNHFQCQRTAAAGRLDVSIGRRCSQNRFERPRAANGSLRRKHMVVTSASGDGGRMSFDETQKAIDIQLRQSSLVKKDEAEGNASSPDSVAQSLKTEMEIMQEAVSRTASQKTEAENVQRDVILRTGSMDDDQISNAIQRQVGATRADWSGDEEEDESMADIVIVDESASAEKPQEEAPESPPAAEKPQEDAAESAPAVKEEDGTLVFSAEALQAVPYDDIELPEA
ncbi:hypothetical protein BSKO_03840 [Bryopsis sp. KO-2023]|nr:hypothetical protein BSKO_03840 [Bryopsis sp. KO-2023]